MTRHRQAKTNKARSVSLVVVLLAMTIVLQRFLAIRTPIISINFAFMPVMLAGMLLGWRGSTFVAVVSDIIGALCFPSGSFFLGYTLTALLSGLVAGILYCPDGIKLERRFIIRLIICVVVTVILLNGVLNTIWVIWMLGGASTVVVPLRILKQCLMLPVEILTMVVIARAFSGQLNRLFFTPAPAEEEDDQN